jgi:hypothetical protein
MNPETYINFFCFFEKFCNSRTKSLDGRSYNGELIEKKVANSNNLKSTLQITFNLDKFCEEFTKVTESFDTNIINKVEAFYDLADIDTVFFVLNNIIQFATTTKSNSFTQAQQGIINKTINNMKSKHKQFPEIQSNNSEPQVNNDKLTLTLNALTSALLNQQAALERQTSLLESLSQQQNQRFNQPNNTTNDSAIASQNSNTNNTILLDTSVSFEDSIKIRMKNLLCKQIKLQDHQKNCKSLMDDNKVFPTLFSYKYAPPFFPNFEPYTDKMKQRIKQRQTEDMEDIRDAIEQQLEELNKEITNLTSKCNDPNIRTKCKDLRTHCENLLQPRLTTSLNKTNTVMNRPLSENLNNKGNISESWFFDRNSDQIQVIESSPTSIQESDDVHNENSSSGHRNNYTNYNNNNNNKQYKPYNNHGNNNRYNNYNNNFNNRNKPSRSRSNDFVQSTPRNQLRQQPSYYNRSRNFNHNNNQAGGHHGKYNLDRNNNGNQTNSAGYFSERETPDNRRLRNF